MAEKQSLLSRAIKTWVTFKAGKGVVKLTSPLAIAGVGYYLFKKYRSGAASSAV